MEGTVRMTLGRAGPCGLGPSNRSYRVTIARPSGVRAVTHASRFHAGRGVEAKIFGSHFLKHGVSPAKWARRCATAVRSAAVDSSEFVEDNSFRIEKISFGSILTPLGVGLLSYGFGAFFQLLPGTEISALMLIYGFPISLLGFALSYAQLKPVPCKTTREALDLRTSQATDIQKQLREDVTRYRYGDEQHLDEALNRIFKFGRGTGIPRRLTPKLVALREEVRDGAYTLVLEFEVSKDMKPEMWTDRQSNIETFFGPGIKATIDAKEGLVDVALICDGSGAGRGGGEKKDVLPPLMPGLPARVNTID